MPEIWLEVSFSELRAQRAEVRAFVRMTIYSKGFLIKKFNSKSLLACENQLPSYKTIQYKCTRPSHPFYNRASDRVRKKS